MYYMVMSFASTAFFLLLVFDLSTRLVLSRPDNVILILTDDQDNVKTGFTALPKTSFLIGENGVTFSNAFATTPVCCPSRSSILTGRYPHNHGTRNNSVSGGCASAHWRENMENHSTFAVHLKQQGYTTFYAGKYLNQYGKKRAEKPAGWDWWYGLVGNSRYYNYTLSVNGTLVEHQDRREDYLTDLMSNYAQTFLDQGHVRNAPFLMVLATPACHDPFTPADKYKDRFSHVRVRKGADFNSHNQGKHWLLQMQPRTLSERTVENIDEIYRNRLKTLLSVDDMVEKIVLRLKETGQLERTHLIFTSDHGFHLGQFAMPWDKRQPYEFDIRVPMMMRGPGVPKNVTLEHPTLLTDLAPTLLQIAGVQDENMDGVSVLPFFEKNTTLQRTFLIEYHGEAHPETVAKECNLAADADQLFECNLENECKCQDSRNNTYVCLRHLSQKCNFIFCQFHELQGFEEAYDLQIDPLQLENIASKLPPLVLKHYRKAIAKLQRCSGRTCSSTFKIFCPDDIICFEN